MYIHSDIFISLRTFPDIPLTPPRDVPQPPVGQTTSNANMDGSCNGSEQCKRSLEEILDLMSVTKISIITTMKYHVWKVNIY